MDVRLVYLLSVLALPILGTSCGGGGGGNGNTGIIDNPPSPMDPLAHSWTVDVATGFSGCVIPDTPLGLTVDVRDSDGDPVVDPQFSISTNGDSELESIDSQWYVRNQGMLELTVTYTGAVDPDSTITPQSFELRSDNSGPDISIDSLQRGEMLIGSNSVLLEGRVTDEASLITSVVINSIMQSAASEQLENGPQEQHDIAFDLSSQWGLNIFEITAEDECGNQSYFTQSYLQSEQYLVAATNSDPGALIQGGQELALTQEAVDDQDRLDTDDVATLLERYLQNELDTLLQDFTPGVELYNDPSCNLASLRVNVASSGMSATLAEVTSIQLKQDTSWEELYFNQVKLPLIVTLQPGIVGLRGACNRSGPFSFNAELSGDLTSESATALTVTNNLFGGNTDILGMDIVNVEVSLTGNSVVDGVLSDITGLLTSYIESSLEDPVENAINDVYVDIFSNLLPQNIEMAVAAFGTEFTGYAEPDGTQTAPWAISLSASTQVFPETSGNSHPAQGSIARDIPPAAINKFQGPVIYAINDNLINQGLWALWESGSLDLDDIIGLQGIKLTIEPIFPPIIMPYMEETTFGLGDVAYTMELNLPPGMLMLTEGNVTVKGFFSVMVGGILDYNPDIVRLQLLGNPDNFQSFIQINGMEVDGTELTDKQVREEIKGFAENLINPAIERLVDHSLTAVTLPPLNIDLTESVVGSTFSYAELSVKSVSRLSDHLVVEADIFVGQPPDLTTVLDYEYTLSDPWTLADLAERLIKPIYWPSLIPPLEDPDLDIRPQDTITYGNYAQSTQVECSNSGKNPDGEDICLTQWQFPLNYGWYCGAGRPVERGVGWLSNPTLDPVDYCCRVHDQNLYDQTLEAASPINACGFAMCLAEGHGTTGISRLMPETERARFGMYTMASALCSMPPTPAAVPLAPLPPLEETPPP